MHEKRLEAIRLKREEALLFPVYSGKALSPE